VSKKHLDVKLALDFTKKINLNVLFYKGLKIEGLELSLKKIQPYFMNEKKLDMETKGRRDK